MGDKAIPVLKSMPETWRYRGAPTTDKRYAINQAGLLRHQPGTLVAVAPLGDKWCAVRYEADPC
jgi:hypothetical protein